MDLSSNTDRHKEFIRLYREGNLEAAKAIADEDYLRAFQLSPEEKRIIEYGLYSGKKEAFDRAVRTLRLRSCTLANGFELAEELQRQILDKRKPQDDPTR